MRYTDTSLATSANAIASNVQHPQPLKTPSSNPSSKSASSIRITPQYVWVNKATALKSQGGKGDYAIGDKVGDRYWVISSHIWQDTQPLTPCNPNGFLLSELPPPALSYLRLQSYALHLPTLYGVLPDSLQSQKSSQSHSLPYSSPGILLLDNVPVDQGGQLLPSIQDNWRTASPVRQVYWLWQILELWQVLNRWEQTSSLLAPINIRVDGWRIRLVNVWNNQQWQERGGPPEPFTEEQPLVGPEQTGQSLPWYLGRLWQSWADQGHPSLIGPLTKICKQLQSSELSWRRIKQDLNILLLQQVAQQPLRLAIASGSSSLAHPIQPGQRGESTSSEYDVSDGFIAPQPWEELDPYVAILCDGVSDPSGNGSAGAMASQLVTRSLKLQLGAFLTEIESHKTLADLITPDVLADQLAAIVRIVNNVLLAQNRSHQISRTSLGQNPVQSKDHKGPSPMSTTATVAIQLPQAVTTPQGLRNSHELYVVSVGNSRAYWLTPTRCHCLTQDDNMAARTVLSQVGRERLSGNQKARESLQHVPERNDRRGSKAQHRGQSYHDAQLQSDASRLTQVLGAKEGEHLSIQVRRLIMEEDGILLLCSHALSDRVEAHWQSITTSILQDQLSLEQAVQVWLESPSTSPQSLDQLPDLPHPLHPHQLAENGDGHSTLNGEASVVLMRCQVSDPKPVAFSATDADQPERETATQMALEIAISQQALSQNTDVDEEPYLQSTSADLGIDRKGAAPSDSIPETALEVISEDELDSAVAVDRALRSWSWVQVVGGCMAMMVGVIALGLTTWRYLDPVLFDRVVVRSTEQFFQSVQGK